MKSVTESVIGNQISSWLIGYHWLSIWFDEQITAWLIGNDIGNLLMGISFSNRTDNS